MNINFTVCKDYWPDIGSKSDSYGAELYIYIYKMTLAHTTKTYTINYKCIVIDGCYNCGTHQSVRFWQIQS